TYDKDIYRWRHLVENYFAKIKEFRGIATRYDKTDTSYAANLSLVATMIDLR
ncbi:MAG: IS5/IS1182 family transposase, partial [Alphaproteobacteria bacterium]|nr:IS5/IS1182 family transposase [Alphaproteobacteria bacterium]